MPFIPKLPPGCAHLDLKEVERVLIRHRANISEAAKELGVSRTDLRRLTWHNPNILEEALVWCDVYVNRCNGLLLDALHSKSRRRREWASDKILSSSMAYGHPFASARWAPPTQRRLGIYTGQARAERQAADELERERVAEFERELAFEMNGDHRPGQEDEETRADIEPARALRAGSLWLDWRDADPVREAPATVSEAPTPESAPQSGLPVWPGPYAPLPLVAHLYAPWTSPKGVLQPQPQREHAPELRRRMSRGGWR